jgi:histone-binding protein RBBP4
MSSGLGSSSGGTGASSGAMMSAPAGAQEPSKDVADVLEERLIDAEYKIWKKNTPYLYDFVMTHSLEWPSLTCQWLPTCKSSQGSSAVEHSLLLGTHTTGEQNYLMVASVNLPKDNAVLDQRTATTPTDAETKDSNHNEQSSSSTSGNGKVKVAGGAVLAAANYDDEKGELGGFGTPSGGVGKIEIRMKIKHEGELNRARYMPQNHFIVATRGPNPEVYIWDLSRHPSMPADDDDSKSPFCPQGVCVGHSREGYGLCWSPHKEGLLLSGSEDKSLCLWDVSSITSSKTRTESGTQFQAVTTFKGHTDVIEDVDWHKRDPNLVGSVSDDRTLRLWDIREKNTDKCVNMVKDVHDGDVNCLSFNPVNEFLVATGGADKTVALWDMRNLTRYETNKHTHLHEKSHFT